MKDSYAVRLPDDSLAVADLVAPIGDEVGWYITRINVPTKWRGRGYGKTLLEKVMYDADRENQVLALIPLATVLPGERGLSEPDLEDWYRRNKFYWSVIRREIIDGDVITEQEMRRMPQ